MPSPGLLKASEIQISMDGKGSWKDNVFVERLWKSVKYEEVYLRAYESVPEARTGLGRYFEFYNAGRPHSSLGGMTPDQFFDRAPAEFRGGLTHGSAIPLIKPGSAVQTNETTSELLFKHMESMSNTTLSSSTLLAPS